MVRTWGFAVFAFSAAVFVRGTSAAPPCPPSRVRVIDGSGGPPAGSDTTPPNVFLSSPAPGAVVSGSVVVSACAADNGGVASVQFKVDGANVGAADTTAPFAMTWDTSGVASGSHTLSAVARDVAGNTATSAGVTVTVSSVLAVWPHEPAGLTPFANWGVGALSGSGWNTVNPNGNATIIADSTAGVSAPNTGQWKYPAGFAGGSAPATMYHALPAAFNEGFVGVEWKASSPWQGHSSFVNKIYFLLGGSCGNLIPIMYGPPGGPYDLRVAPEWGGGWSFLTPNVTNVPVTLGTWHKIELYFKYNSPGAGIVRWWMDGTLIGDYRNVTFPASGCFAEFQLSPTWGGVGGTKSSTDYFWFDHVYISVPGGAPSDPPPPSGTLLFQEGFEDANLAARGWYDNATPLLSTDHVAGSTNSIQYKFNQGATSPTAGSAVRRKFTPTDSVYLGYWVKYSTNWVGSQKPYHPHEFHFLTTADGDWSGLSFDRLTTYIEQNGGTPLIAIQDGSNVDQTKIGVNLTSVTEARGVAGCNGSSDGYPDNCYSNGSAFVNEKKWFAASQFFTDSPGQFYKSDWHFVEAYVKMNTVVGGKGINNGVVQYWFDGHLIIDHHDVLLRTAVNATMQFNQLVIAPYIGDGSPVTQSMWIDSLSVGTGKS
jgi:Bacterial Ig domain